LDLRGRSQTGPARSAGKLTGEYDGKMILGGFVFQGRWKEEGPAGETRGLEMYRYDPVNKNSPIEAYTDNGSSYSAVMSISGNTFTFSGKFLAAGKSHDGRIVMTNAADGMSITLKADISTDGKTWTPFVESKYNKANSATKK
jgi:hypothetical protein